MRIFIFYILIALNYSVVVTTSLNAVTFINHQEGKRITISNSLWNTVFPALAADTTHAGPAEATIETKFPIASLEQIATLINALGEGGATALVSALDTLTSHQLQKLWRLMGILGNAPRHNFSHIVMQQIAQTYYRERCYGLRAPNYFSECLHLIHLNPPCTSDVMMYLYLELENSERRIIGPTFIKYLDFEAFISQHPNPKLLYKYDSPFWHKIIAYNAITQHITAQQAAELFEDAAGEHYAAFVNPLIGMGGGAALRIYSLFYAIQTNNTDLTRALKHFGYSTNINYTQYEGQPVSTLALAIIFNLPDMVKTLLELRANPLLEIPAPDGSDSTITVLQYALHFYRIQNPIQRHCTSTRYSPDDSQIRSICLLIMRSAFEQCRRQDTPVEPLVHLVESYAPELMPHRDPECACTRSCTIL